MRRFPTRSLFPVDLQLWDWSRLAFNMLININYPSLLLPKVFEGGVHVCQIVDDPVNQRSSDVFLQNIQSFGNFRGQKKCSLTSSLPGAVIWSVIKPSKCLINNLQSLSSSLAYSSTSSTTCSTCGSARNAAIFLPSSAIDETAKRPNPLKSLGVISR